MYDAEIKKIVVKGNFSHPAFGDLFIFYTKAGESNAKLLAKYATYYIEHLKGISPLNHYLVGYLLGYDKKDIKFFYKRVNILNQFEQDKKAAKQFIQENS